MQKLKTILLLSEDYFLFIIGPCQQVTLMRKQNHPCVRGKLLLNLVLFFHINLGGQKRMGSLQTGFPLKFSLLHYLPLSHDGDSIQGQGLPAVCWMETSQQPAADLYKKQLFQFLLNLAWTMAIQISFVHDCFSVGLGVHNYSILSDFLSSFSTFSGEFCETRCFLM